MTEKTDTVPVVVAGAGPVGLMLAAELRLAGVPAVVLERLAAPTGESRGLGYTARTLESLDQRGLLPRLGGVETSDVGHFGGVPLDFGVLEGAHFGGKGIPQNRTEEMLASWAHDTGADIRRGHEVVGLADDGDGVDVDVEGPDGPYRIRAAYLAGCDGGRSTVRRLAGIGFPGTAATTEMVIADVTGADIAPRWAGEPLPGGMVLAGPLADGVTRIVVCERGRPPRKRTEPPPFAEVAAAWQRLTGEDISGGGAVWTTAFGDAARQAEHYRRGRVLLAGDAAHIHLPAGGQGMNVGIQDAVNLGWKLGAAAAGRAPEGLLDTYHAERHPVGARLLMNTQAQGLLFLTGENTGPMRELLTELVELPEVARHLVAMVSGLEVRYDVGPGDHPLLGRRMPPRRLVTEEGTASTPELLHAARGVLLDLSGDPALRDTARGWADRVDTVAAKPVDGDAGLGAPADAVLIRPDGYVAWTSPGAGGLAEALTRWFGPAA
ncbi:FAD-dependent monooxygenase [Nocardiopsis sp. RSe5-2]|uniref:FAD-dependent monooxygenase n=1 Tax=Nocardiopsis endophytica TaxID=3018445 RepID=A0ABT4TWM9_9ACTN|nr:FAD-dependent monooxygenase [Nocardiopsis endophytica]MDA2809100.1 FAD-dependent monooxygenase [Nocardiopsis endophytica]